MKKFFYLLSILCLSAVNAEAKANAKSISDHVGGDIIIQLKEINKLSVKDQVDHIQTSLSPFGILKIGLLRTESQILLVKIAEDSELSSAIAKLESLPEVVFAEPNYKVHLLLNNSDDLRGAGSTGIPNDPNFAKNWSLRNVGQTAQSKRKGKLGADINVLPLWAQGAVGSKKIIVGVVDTGVDWNHEDLKENIYTNPGEAGALATNGKDDDKNGFIDDVHGWNFENNTNNSKDDNHHGTHCSGTIGAIGNNGIGIAGVNWNTSILPIKFLDNNGAGDVAGAIEGISYAIKMGAKVLNNSWGGGPYSKALKVAIEKAYAANILFVVAAGNDGQNNDKKPSYPASYDVPNVISVAATNNLDDKSDFSNYGSKTVDVAAPGEEIYSTFPNNQYGYLSGTSMAAPHISGIAALMFSINPRLTPLQVKEALVKTARPVVKLKKYVKAQGGVDVFKAMNSAMVSKEKIVE